MSRWEIRRSNVIGSRPMLRRSVRSLRCSGATVKRSVLLPGASIGDGAYLEGCIIGPGFDVQPKAMVRDRTLVFAEQRGSLPRKRLTEPTSVM